MKYTNDFVCDLYKQMLEIRLSEEKLIESYLLGKVPGHIHSGIGEEAPFVGTLATRKENDYYKLTHRPISVAKILGGNYDEMFGEVFGKAIGTAKGLSGGNYIAYLEKGILGISGTLGCDVPIAVGASIKVKKSGEDNMVYCFYGDGTSNRGTLHEAMNMAGAWKLPVLFICTNNQFAISTHCSVGSAVPNPGGDRASAYGMPSKVVDGNDVFAVYEAAKELSEYVRSGNGPALLETKCYRRRGHFEGDLAQYRSAEVTEQEAEKDCINKMENYLLDNQIMTSEELGTVRDEIAKELEAAVKSAEESRDATVEEIYENIYA